MKSSKEEFLEHVARCRNGGIGPLEGREWHNEDFSGVYMSLAAFKGCVFKECNFEGADMGATHFHGCAFVECILDGVDAISADFFESFLVETSFHGATLRHASFEDARLIRCNLADVDTVHGAILYNADLRGTEFPSPTLMLLASWGSLSEALTQRAMAFDAASHPDPSAFVEWARAWGGMCPYGVATVQRAVLFAQVRACYDPDVPAPRVWDLFRDLLAEKTMASNWHDHRTDARKEVDRIVYQRLGLLERIGEEPPAYVASTVPTPVPASASLTWTDEDLDQA